jgi:hypothetical protein
MLRKLLLVGWSLAILGQIGCQGEKPPEPTPENVQQELKNLNEARQREAGNQ